MIMAISYLRKMNGGESVQGYTEGKTITIRGKNGHDSF